MKTREELLNQLGQLEGYFDELEIFQVLAKDYSADAVDRILSAPTQAQLDCPYCHKGKHVYICENTYLEITPGETRVCKKRVIDYEEWQIGAVKFDYCPMCGRKLGDE